MKIKALKPFTSLYVRFNKGKWTEDILLERREGKGK
jgi:hypothetical protein